MSHFKTALSLTFCLMLILGGPHVVGAQQSGGSPPGGSGGGEQESQEATEQDQDEQEEATEEPSTTDGGSSGSVSSDSEQESGDEEQRQRQVVGERDQQPRFEMIQDSDDDGLVNYDEINIYGTDPRNPDTSGNGIEDGQMVARGLDPTSVSTQQIEYEDPREEPGSAVSDRYKVTKASATSSGRTYFEGTGPSSSYVTLFFFSTPIIVTAQVDGAGKWTYELDQELPDGEHEMYVATVNNQGKIMAQSDPVNFDKTASAIEVQPGPSAAVPRVQDSHTTTRCRLRKHRASTSNALPTRCPLQFTEHLAYPLVKELCITAQSP